MNYVEIAQGLRNHLALQFEPVGVRTLSQQPEDIYARASSAQSSCSFWRRAEQGMLYASADDHAGCSVGAHVMGLPMTEETRQALGLSVRMMANTQYLHETEVANIPTVSRQSAGVVYGPLRQFTEAVDCAIVWTTPTQAMLLNEAVGGAQWGSAGLRLTGRPACAAIANACNTSGPAMSLGCSGMRLFTEIDPGLCLFVIPGALLEGLVNSLQKTLISNEQMLTEYRRRKVTASA